MGHVTEDIEPDYTLSVTLQESQKGSQKDPLKLEKKTVTALNNIWSECKKLTVINSPQDEQTFINMLQTLRAFFDGLEKKRKALGLPFYNIYKKINETAAKHKTTLQKEIDRIELELARVRGERLKQANAEKAQLLKQAAVLMLESEHAAATGKPDAQKLLAESYGKLELASSTVDPGDSRSIKFAWTAELIDWRLADQHNPQVLTHDFSKVEINKIISAMQKSGMEIHAGSIPGFILTQETKVKTDKLS